MQGQHYRTYEQAKQQKDRQNFQEDNAGIALYQNVSQRIGNL